MTDIKVVQGVPVLPIHLVGTAVQGPKGENAYQLAVANGFVGTVVDWLNSLKGPATEFRVTATHIQWRQVGQTAWVNLIATSQLGIRLRTNAGNIEWSPVATTAWTVLLPLSDLTGPPGPTPILTIGTVVPGEPNEASATFTGTAANPALNLVLPRGRQGIQGIQGNVGPMVDVEAGSATSLPPGSDPTLDVVGTGATRTLNLGVPQGLRGLQGDKGDRAWTPVLSIVADGERRVHHVDWANGSGIKPVTGYLGYSGVTSDIADALDIRGPQGSAGTGQGDMVAANNLSEVDPAAARANIQAAHEGGTVNFTSVNYGTGGASVFSDNDGSLLVHAGSPALSEAFFDFNKDGNLHSYQGSFFSKDGEVWHPGNLPASSLVRTSGNQQITGNLTLKAPTGYVALQIDGPDNANNEIIWRNGAQIRWLMRSNAANSLFEMISYNDEGVSQGSVITIPRVSKVVDFKVTPTVLGQTIYHTGNLPVDAGVTGWAYVADLDPLTKGFASTSTISSTNGRPNNSWHQVLTLARNEDNGAQIAVGVQGDALRYRRKNNGTWSNWVTVHDTGNFDPATKMDVLGGVFSGNVDITRGNALTSLTLSAFAGNHRDIAFKTNGVPRWAIRATNGAESGTSAGSDFQIHRWDNSGAWIDTVINIPRDTGKVTFRHDIVLQAGIDGGASGVTVGGTGGMTIAGSGGLSVTGASGITTSGSGGITTTAGHITIQRTTADPNLILSSNAGRTQMIQFRTGDSARWNVFCDNSAEGGSNAGSNFVLRRYSDAGASLGDVLKIMRNNGEATFGAVVRAPNFIATSDEKLKMNWREAAPDGWTRGLPGIKHGLHDWRSKKKGSSAGVGAQGLQKMLPSVVRTDSNGHLGVDYGPAAMLAAIDLAKRVAVLEKKLEALLNGAA